MTSAARAALTLLLLSACLGIRAQQQPPQQPTTAAPAAAPQETEPEPPPPSSTYTLRVFTNLLQTATLILNSDDENIPNVPRDKVSISLDGGPKFHPTQMRQEGADATHIVFLLDVSGGDQALADAVAKALPKLAADALHPSDHISLYALDCKLIGSLKEAPPDPAMLAKGLSSVLAYPSLHDARGHHCASTLHLWDQVAIVADRMAQSPGRRVLVLVTPGLDSNSYITVPRLALFLGQHGISTFALRDSTAGSSMRPYAMPPQARATSDPLTFVTESNGGIVFNIPPLRTGATLDRLVRLLRSRYIVEFPAPDHANGGFHAIEIKVPKASQVLSSGIGWTEVDPSLKSDPNTIPGAASPAVFGEKRPADPR